jgi:hypothetical protein
VVYTLRFFPFQNAAYFIILTYLVPVLFTFYIQDVLKLKKSGAKRVTLIAFPLQQWLQGRTSVLRCTCIARLVSIKVGSRADKS